MDGPIARDFQLHVAYAKLQYLARAPVVGFVPESAIP